MRPRRVLRFPKGVPQAPTEKLNELPSSRVLASDMNPKILFIGTSCPFGEISGAGHRTLNLIRLLERIGTVKTVFATGLEWSAEQLERTRDEFDLGVLSRYLNTPGRSPVERFRKVFDSSFLNTNGVEVPPEDRVRVAKLVEQNDMVWVHTLKVANAFRRFHWPKTVLDLDDIPSGYHLHAAKHATSCCERLLRKQRAFSSRRMEMLSLDRFELLTICKEADLPVFGSSPRVRVIPNGFSAPEAVVGEIAVSRSSGRIGMIGDFQHLPNHDGLRWFVKDVWAKLRLMAPDLDLRLVGKGSGALAEEFPGLGISGLGYVPDVAEETASWSCMIVPTRMGGGTHLKVAEGLARRIPIVTTSHGARGYELVSGKQAFLADSPSEFIKACATLIREPLVGDRLAAAGWELFQNRYSWVSILPAVERTVQDCLARSKR